MLSAGGDLVVGKEMGAWTNKQPNKKQNTQFSYWNDKLAAHKWTEWSSPLIDVGAKQFMIRYDIFYLYSESICNEAIRFHSVQTFRLIANAKVM